MPDLPNEYTQVERPLIEQLQLMGWQHITGDTEVPDFTERSSFREVLLAGRLRAALRALNLGEDGQPWLDDGQLRPAQRWCWRTSPTSARAQRSASALKPVAGCIAGRLRN